MAGNRHPGQNAGAVKALAAGSWLPILETLAPCLLPALQRPGKHVPCPIHGGIDGFRVFPDVARTGGAICNSCGSFADGFSLIMWANNWTFTEAVQAVQHEIGLSSSSLPEVRTQRLVSPELRQPIPLRLAELKALWRQSLPLAHPAAHPARCYLQFRVPGLNLPAWPHALRFHDGLPYYDKRGKFQGRYPTLLARVQGPDGRGVTIHRTYLTPDGRKADVEAPKKLMAPYQPGATIGSAIRLFDAAATLVIGEGIETCLSVHMATSLPVWAAVSANGLAQAIIPREIHTVIICSDHDVNGVGQQAAYTLADRLAREGRAVKVLIPPSPDTDWNDHVVRSQAPD